MKLSYDHFEFWPFSNFLIVYSQEAESDFFGFILWKTYESYTNSAKKKKNQDLLLDYVK